MWLASSCFPEASRKHLQWIRCWPLLMIKDYKNFYSSYLDCLNTGRLEALSEFVNSKLLYNQQQITLPDYHNMLLQNKKDIPDLFFDLRLLVTSGDKIAARLSFNCTPVGSFLGIPVNGRKVEFTEHVFYQLKNNKIATIWSLIDTDIIKSQVATA